MPTLKEISSNITKSERLKKALFSEESNEVDVLSIFVDLGLAIYEATKTSCAATYGRNKYLKGTEIKKFIKETEFPKNINFLIK